MTSIANDVSSTPTPSRPRDPEPSRETPLDARAGDRSLGLARLTGLAGLVATALGAAALGLLVAGPRFGDAPEVVRAGVADHVGRSVVGALLGAWGSLAAVAWMAGLRQVLDRRDPVDRFRGDLALLATLLLFALILVACGSGLGAAVQSGLPGGLGAEFAAFLATASLVLINLSAVPTVLVVMAIVGPFRRAAWLPRWIVGLTIAVGVAHLGASMSMAGSGVLAVDGIFAVAAPLLWYAWTLAVSVVLLRRGALSSTWPGDRG